MGRKRLLNITSRKKRDTMQTYGNLPDGTPSTTFSLGPQLLKAGPNQFYNLLWSPTWRNLYRQGTTLPATISETAIRSASTIYLRGLKEHVSIETIGSSPWRWRRIVFSTKGLLEQVPQDALFAYGLERVDEGYVRVVNTMTPAAYNLITANLFKGVATRDWNLPIAAQVDTSRVTVHYDKTRLINPPNESGMVRDIKLWHGFNKNVVYNDDEDGEKMTGVPWSTRGKPGIGDIMVFDCFDCGLSGDPEDRLQLNFNSTLYWHEK